MKTKRLAQKLQRICQYFKFQIFFSCFQLYQVIDKSPEESILHFYVLMALRCRLASIFRLGVENDTMVIKGVETKKHAYTCQDRKESKHDLVGFVQHFEM